MADPSKPLRLKREGMALYLANGYGPSAAYSSAGYGFKSREHLSKNAATLAANSVVKSRVEWLQERPQEAASLLRQWNAQRDEAEALERTQVLSGAVAKRQEAIERRAARTAPASPVCSVDDATLLDLLHHCQDEAKAIYERAKLERADPYIIKTSLSAHRDFTVSLQRFRDDAKVALSQETLENPAHALEVYSSMCAALDEPAPTLLGEKSLQAASVTEQEASHDENELRFNIAATLYQYDLLSDAEIRPDMRVQLQLLDVLAKATQRLISLQARRRGLNDGHERKQGADFQIDPSVVLRWTQNYEIA